MSEREIFDKALSIANREERSRYLDEVCANNERLRGHIDGLLSAHEDLGSFLQSPPVAGASPTIDQPPLENLGTQIGSYKLLQQIGEGGMGVVYMAEQKGPVERRVALKIIKPGMDTQQVIARFESERQALALMDHPNIAKVHDAGTTDSGRPYFVMELVNGIPVTQFCDEQQLTARERLELFIPICQAVQHAHQKGIIHRDIKPSNILIALYDSRAVPKVIDFGVAKAISQKLTEKTVFTNLGQIVGTLEYMSPEQAQRNQLDIDTRSDVYSLGVVLYELLTGDTPFDKRRLRSSAWDEMLRIIREEEPPKPSTKLSSSEILASLAANRKIDPAKLSALVRGDLDWIVMKALEKDRTRRYETAVSLARDIQRYLADEPVEARPPSAVYRFRKFARRNGVSFLAGVVAIVALLGGAAVAGWQGVRATRALRALERQQTDTLHQQKLAQENFRLARTAVDDCFAKVRESRLSSLRKELLESSLKYYRQFVEQQTADPRLRSDVASAYWRIAEILGRLGYFNEAVNAYHLALASRKSIAADNPDDATLVNDVAECYCKLGEAQGIIGRPREAAESYQQATEIWEELVANSLDDANIRHRLSNAYGWLSIVQRQNQDFAGALVSCEKACQSAKLLMVEHSGVASYASTLGRWYTELATIQRAIGESERANRTSRNAIEIQEQVLTEHLSVETDPYALAATYDALSTLCPPDEALHYCDKAIEIYERLAVQEPNTRPAIAESCMRRGHVQEAMRRLDDALASFYKAAAIREQLVAENPEYIFEPVLAESYHYIGILSTRCGKVEQALAAYRKAIEYRQGYVVKNPTVAPFQIRLSESYNALATLQMMMGKSDDALSSSQEVVDLVTAIPEEERRFDAWGVLGESLYRVGRWEEARQPLEKHIERCCDLGPTLRGGPRWWYLTMVLARLGDTDTARSYYGHLTIEAQEQEPPHRLHQFLQAEAAELLDVREPDPRDEKKEKHDSQTSNGNEADERAP